MVTSSALLISSIPEVATQCGETHTHGYLIVLREGDTSVQSRSSSRNDKWMQGEEGVRVSRIEKVAAQRYTIPDLLVRQAA